MSSTYQLPVPTQTSPLPLHQVVTTSIGGFGYIGESGTGYVGGGGQGTSSVSMYGGGSGGGEMSSSNMATLVTTTAGQQPPMFYNSSYNANNPTMANMVGSGRYNVTQFTGNNSIPSTINNQFQMSPFFCGLCNIQSTSLENHILHLIKQHSQCERCLNTINYFKKNYDQYFQ